MRACDVAVSRVAAFLCRVTLHPKSGVGPAGEPKSLRPTDGGAPVYYHLPSAWRHFSSSGDGHVCGGCLPSGRDGRRCFIRCAGQMARPDARSKEAAEYRRLYKTAKWQRLRQAQLTAEPLCRWCLEREIVTEATEVHHDGPHRGNVAKFWDGPFISTCKSCHASRGQREDLGQKVVTFGIDGWPID